MTGMVTAGAGVSTSSNMLCKGFCLCKGAGADGGAGALVRPASGQAAQHAAGQPLLLLTTVHLDLLLGHAEQLHAVVLPIGGVNKLKPGVVLKPLWRPCVWSPRPAPASCLPGPGPGVLTAPGSCGPPWCCSRPGTSSSTCPPQSVWPGLTFRVLSS